jgi:nitroreductase
MDIYEALYTTRSMRRLKPDPIPVDAQARILDAAIRAPSGSNAQAWRFLLIDDPDIKARFATLVQGSWNRRPAANDPSLEVLPPAIVRSVAHLVEHFAETPLLLLGFAKDEAAASIYPALWSAQLAARAEGIGSTLTTFLTREPETVFPILGVPQDEGWRMYGCITLGYPTGRWDIAARRPAHEVAGRNGWAGALGFKVHEPLWGQDDAR